MQSNQVVVWVDHREAHVLYFDASKNELVKSQSTHTHLHHKANTIGSGNAPEDHEFFYNVISAVADANEILFVGPGSAKTEILKFAVKHDPDMAKRIIGIETVDHPTDGQVLAFAKKYFYRLDQLKSM